MTSSAGSGSIGPGGPPPGSGRGTHCPNDADRIANPMLAWAVRTNFSALGGPPEWIPLLVHTPNGTVRQVGDALLQSFPPIAVQGASCDLFVIPELFLQIPGLQDANQYVVMLNWRSGELRQSALDILDVLQQEHRASYDFGLPPGPATAGPIPWSAARCKRGQPPPFSLNGALTPFKSSSSSQAKVVVGVIDDAFALAHDRLRLPGGTQTRVDAAWVQDIGGPWGTEYLNFHIDAELAACTHAGLVDESEVYASLGLEDFGDVRRKLISRRLTHGAHVMDIAAGYSATAAPTDRPIVAVQLPGRVVRDTSGALLTPWALLGILYILYRSQASAGRFGDVPVVINLSYGVHHQAHDGTSAFERAVDWLVRWWNAAFKGRLCVVLPGGNNYLWRSHARFALPVKGRKNLAWRVIPNDRTPTFCEIWLPHPSAGSPAPSATVMVRSPEGVASPPMTLGSAPFVVSAGGGPAWQVNYWSSAQTLTRPCVTVWLAPTDTLDAAATTAPSGVWAIEVENPGSGPVVIDVWIGRDDTPLGWPVQGRQSYFDDPDYVRFDAAGRDVEVDSLPGSYIRRSRTLNGLATGARTVVLAGIRQSDSKAARYSAAGPIVPNPGMGGFPLPRFGTNPDAAAISEHSPAMRGVLAAGTRSNSAAAMSGTSVAAPQITRWIADAKAAGCMACRDEVGTKAALSETAKPRPIEPAPDPTTTPADRIGNGRIDSLEPPLPSVPNLPSTVR